MICFDKYVSSNWCIHFDIQNLTELMRSLNTRGCVSQNNNSIILNGKAFEEKPEISANEKMSKDTDKRKFDLIQKQICLLVVV